MASNGGVEEIIIACVTECCKAVMNYELSLLIKGLLAITIDGKQILTVDFNEFLKRDTVEGATHPDNTHYVTKKSIPASSKPPVTHSSSPSVELDLWAEGGDPVITPKIEVEPLDEVTAENMCKLIVLAFLCQTF